MKHYSKEFKEEALKLSDEIGVKKAAQQLGHPQAVEVAVCVNSHCLVISQGEGNIGVITGLEGLALATVLRLDIDPLDEVLRSHGMVHSAHIDVDRAIFHSDHRQMLFTAGLHSVGLQSLHFLAAAHHRHAGVMDHAHQIAAVTADVKLCAHQ